MTSRTFAALLALSLITWHLHGQERPPLLLERGQSLPLPAAVKSNERAFTSVAYGDGRLFGATSGQWAKLVVVDLARSNAKQHAALAWGAAIILSPNPAPHGGVRYGVADDLTGFSSVIDNNHLGLLGEFRYEGTSPAHRIVGRPLATKAIYALTCVGGGDELVGLTWPDGHFVSCEFGKHNVVDLGPIAGYRTYETPRYAEKINQGTDRKLVYSRQVSRVIAVDPATGAYTAGEGGLVYRYDPATKKLSKLAVRLPAAAGREAFASWDAACVLPAGGERRYTSILGGTSDGYVFELRVHGPDKHELHSWGKPFAEPGIYGLVAREERGEAGATITVDGLAGHPDGITRAFQIVRGPDRFDVIAGRPPVVDGQPSMEPFSNLVLDSEGNVFGGERCRIGRLVKFSASREDPSPKPTTKRPAIADATSEPSPLASAKPLPCRVVFAPDGTTTEASGYTAIEVGRDGRVYVGSARYGDYAYLLRFTGTHALGGIGQAGELPTFMEKVVYLRDLTGEHREGLNTQGKIHAKILAGQDGRIWFATKQAHEAFGTRPEYEDPLGYPGGHLCVYDPARNEARTLGILKHREGLMGGALDEARGKLYFRSEPRNHFLVYDLATGKTRDCGNLGAAGRYMAIDKQGAVWAFGRGQTICRYDPEKQLVEDFPVKVEGEGEFVEPYVVLLGPDGKLYGVRGGHAGVMRFEIDTFDPAAEDAQVVMRNIAPTALAGYPVLDIHAAAFGKDGRLYWPLVTAEPADAAKRSARVLVIMRLDLATGKSELVGRPQIEGLDEDKVRHTYIREDKYALDHMQGACVGPDGTLYLMDIYPQLNVACFPKLTAD